MYLTQSGQLCASLKRLAQLPYHLAWLKNARATPDCVRVGAYGSYCIAQTEWIRRRSLGISACANVAVVFVCHLWFVFPLIRWEDDLCSIGEMFRSKTEDKVVFKLSSDGATCNRWSVHRQMVMSRFALSCTISDVLFRREN